MIQQMMNRDYKRPTQAEIDSYRRDGRSLDEFALDIKEGTEKEQWIIDRYAKMLWERSGRKKTFCWQNNGCGNHGELLATANTKADFLFNGHPLEVKFSNHWCNVFRFKVDQIVSYCNQGADLLFVNGLETSSPYYLLFTNAYLRWLMLHGKVDRYEGWMKEVYVLKANHFLWARFE